MIWLKIGPGFRILTTHPTLLSWMTCREWEMLWEYKPKASTSILLEKGGNILSFSKKKHSFSHNYQNKFSSEFIKCSECFSNILLEWILINTELSCLHFFLLKAIQVCLKSFSTTLDPVSRKNITKFRLLHVLHILLNRNYIMLVFPEILTYQTLIFALIKNRINSKCYPFPIGM